MILCLPTFLSNTGGVHPRRLQVRAKEFNSFSLRKRNGGRRDTDGLEGLVQSDGSSATAEVSGCEIRKQGELQDLVGGHDGNVHRKCAKYEDGRLPQGAAPRSGTFPFVAFAHGTVYLPPTGRVNGARGGSRSLLGIPLLRTRTFGGALKHRCICRI